MTTEVPMTLSGRLALLTYGVLAGIAAGTLAPILPRISDEFSHGANGVYITTVSTILGLGVLIGAPLGGMLADRLGRRPVMLGASLLYAVAGCSIGLSSTLWDVIIARFIVGIANGALAASAFALIGDRFDDQGRSRWTGYMTATSTVAVLVISPIIGFVADYSWRASFLVYVLGLAGYALIVIGITPDRSERKAVLSVAATGPSARGSLPWKVILVSLAAGTIALAAPLYIPFRLREVGVHSSGQIALYLLPSTIGGAAMAAGYGKIRLHLSVQGVFIIFMIASSLALATMALAHNALVISAAMFVEALAVGALMPNTTLFSFANSTVENRARAVGIMKGSVAASPFAAQFLLGPISLYGGPMLSLFTVSAVAALTALIFAASYFTPAKVAAAA